MRTSEMFLDSVGFELNSEAKTDYGRSERNRLMDLEIAVPPEDCNNVAIPRNICEDSQLINRLSINALMLINVHLHNLSKWF
jgi:hypothetical protein